MSRATTVRRRKNPVILETEDFRGIIARRLMRQTCIRDVRERGSAGASVPSRSSLNPKSREPPESRGDFGDSGTRIKIPRRNQIAELSASVGIEQSGLDGSSSGPEMWS